MEFLVSALKEALVYCHAIFPNWGLAIVSVTVFLRLILLPLQYLGFKQQALMSRIQPELAKVKLQHEADPRKSLEAQAQVMKEAGARPWVSMLALFLQMPLFFAIFRALGGDWMTGSAFFWIPTLGAPDPLFLLPALGALVFWLQSRKSNGGKMGWALAGVSFAFMIAMPAGIALYSLTSGIVQFLGQKIFERIG